MQGRGAKGAHGTPNPKAPGSNPGGPATSTLAVTLLKMGKSKGAVHVGIRRLPGFAGRAANFLREVVAELKKVVWPSKEQLLVLSGMVVLSIPGLAIYILILDYIFSFFINALKLFR